MAFQSDCLNFNVLVVSDTHNCDDADLERIAEKAREFNCPVIIHAGDMIDKHLGHPLFSDFEVYVFLTHQNKHVPANLPSNWTLLDEDNCLIDIGGHRFYVNHYLGVDVLHTKTHALLSGNLSDGEVYQIVGDILNRYKRVEYAIFGHSHHTFHHCNYGVALVNPGAWEFKRTYALLFLNEIKQMKLLFSTMTVNGELVE